MLNITEGLSYDDVLLVPQYSEIETRSPERVSLAVKLPKIGTELKHPIVPANMKTVFGEEMAKAVYLSRGLGFLHRFMPIEEQKSILSRLWIKHKDNLFNHIGSSVGVKKEDYENVPQLIDIGAKIICIDIAHGDSKLCVDMCRFISTKYPKVLLVAGNVATETGARRLWDNGADVVKCGIGGGSLCSTRIQTGNGMPMITSLDQVQNAKTKFKDKLIIADGGVKDSGDCTKALVLADLVMAGNLFAGTEEAPGTKITKDGILYKEYAGSSTHKSSHVEGVTTFVPYKGMYTSVLDKLLQGIRSGMSYQGVDNLVDLKENPQFVKISSAGYRESIPHGVL
jgi:IMP dehydrogenase